MCVWAWGSPFQLEALHALHTRLPNDVIGDIPKDFPPFAYTVSKIESSSCLVRVCRVLVQGIPYDVI